MTDSRHLEIADLVAHLRDGNLTEEQVRRLDDLLRGDPAAQACYLGHVNLICDLRHYHNRSGGRRLWVDGTCELEAVSPDDLACLSRALVAVGEHDAQAFRRAGRLRMAGWAMAAMLVIGLGLAAWMGLQGERRAAGGAGLVRLAGSHQAMWKEPAAADLSTPMVLESGLAVLELGEGVAATLEGPARATWLGKGRLKLDHGRLHVRLSGPAKSFEVLTPLLRVVDEGTAFGLDVENSGAVELHVTEGRVAYQVLASGKDPAAPARRLLGGYAVRVSSDRKVESIAVAAARFVTAQQAADPGLLSRSLATRIWREQVERVSVDPSALWVYAAQENWQRQIPSPVPARQAGEGQVTGVRPVPGRWEGKQAMGFSRPGNHVALRIDEPQPQFTMAAWVWFDRLNSDFTALVMSDAWTQPGHTHWQVNEAGQLVLGVNGSGKGDHRSPRGTISESLLRKWVHLAVVYDAPARRVAHYLNGRRVAEIPLDHPLPLIFGSARVGDWMGLRTLNGRIDELLIFSRAASDQEIAHWHEMGRKPLP